MVAVVVGVFVLVLAIVDTEGLVLEEVAVVPELLAVEAGAPGSLSMVPSGLLAFDPRLF